jgi:hypothetical protein
VVPRKSSLPNPVSRTSADHPRLAVTNADHLGSLGLLVNDPKAGPM